MRGALLPSAPMKSTADIIALPTASPSPSLSGLFKALGDELRLPILRAMARDSYNVSELCSIFSVRQSALSHHLKILVDAGLLARRKEGTATFYRRALPDDIDNGLHRLILNEIDQTGLPEAIERGIQKVQEQRETNSREFFWGNISRFRKQQELIAPWQDYSEATLQLLRRANVARTATIAEIGPGEGWLLPSLRDIAAKVVAIDLSAAMLERARAHAGHLEGITFIEGNTKALKQHRVRAEAIVANMVLHHTPDPQAVLNDASAALKPGGSLIVSDLCAHDQAWVREYCGDLWLGFTPDQIREWAMEASLEPHAELFLAQRNGFQIQIQHFQRR